MPTRNIRKPIRLRILHFFESYVTSCVFWFTFQTNHQIYHNITRSIWPYWGFHTWGTQKIDGLFPGISQPNMDENGGVPLWLRNPPYRANSLLTYDVACHMCHARFSRALWWRFWDLRVRLDHSGRRRRNGGNWDGLRRGLGEMDHFGGVKNSPKHRNKCWNTLSKPFQYHEQNNLNAIYYIYIFHMYISGINYISGIIVMLFMTMPIYQTSGKLVGFHPTLVYGKIYREP